MEQQPDDPQEAGGFSSRAFTACLLLFATLALAATGLVLYFGEGISFDKTAMREVHTAVAVLLLCAVTAHAARNWEALLASVARAAGGLRRFAEPAAALALVAAVVAAAALLSLPPGGAVRGRPAARPAAPALPRPN